MQTLTLTLTIENKPQEVLLFDFIKRNKIKYKIVTEEEEANDFCMLDHTPNAETIEAIKEVRKGNKLKKYKNVEDLLNDLKKNIK